MTSKSSPPLSADAALGGAARRPRELQDALNFHLFHPLALRLAKALTSTRVTPNMVSVAGGLLVVLAALAYARPGWPWAALAGFALHLAWHVVDGADGDLARLTGRSSPQGELVDGICDYAGHIVLYLVLGSLLQATIGPIAWLFAVGAGASRIVQANHYEVQRRQYQWWVYGVPWLRASRGQGASEGKGALFGTAYLKLAQKIAPHAIPADRAVMAARENPERAERALAAIRRHAQPILDSLPLLGANYRTVALGFSMLAGSPIYFFLWEAVALNLVLIRSVRISNRSTCRLIAELDHHESSTRR